MRLSANHSRGHSIKTIMRVILLFMFVSAANLYSMDRLVMQEYDQSREVMTVKADAAVYSSLKNATQIRSLEFPVSPLEKVILELEEFSITSPQTQFLIGTPGGNIETDAPDMILLRGKVSGQEKSTAYIALSSSGMGNGLVSMESGETFILAKTPEESVRGWSGSFTISRQSTGFDLPDGVEFCRIEYPPDYVPPDHEKDIRAMGTGPYLIKVALEADQDYYNLFGNMGETQAYAIMVFGLISTIYERDLDIKLVVDFLRVWPDGGEPFSPDYLYGFAMYWLENMESSQYNIIHMLSGRRNLDYGGVAYVSGICYSYYPFGISAYINGCFAQPFGETNIGNWDIQVTAHEMGHNCGVHHTHDLEPPIDQCPDGIPARSTIMSYCHTLAGGLSNTDLRFHRRIQDLIKIEMISGGCDVFDCNGNNISDAIDISTGYSVDTNSDGIPDECQDCNNNGILDPDDIAGAETDLNGNGVPDVCETDCNGNLLPDEWEIYHEYAEDENGNYIIDACEPDCNSNGLPDFAEIADGITDDFDRNNVPDECQDCDGNLVSDWLDLGRQHNIFVSDFGGYIREFHAVSGYPIKNYTSALISQPYDITAGPDRLLYIADIGTDQVLRLDPYNDLVELYAPSGSVSDPASLIFGPDGQLYVTCKGDNTVKSISGSLATPVDFVTSGSGGLNNPWGLTFGPDGNLYVCNGDNSVLKYSGSDGSFIGVFVSAGSGGLEGIRGIVFDSDGDLLVASNNTNEILKYDGASGAFIGVFNDSPISQVWGIRVAPDGNILASEFQNTTSPYIYVFLPNGLKYLNYIRGVNSGLVNPTGFDMLPAHPDDCNQNNIPDVCDIASGILTDANSDDIPDECAEADTDGDGIAEGIDNCPGLANPTQTDVDHDGIGDACDNCPHILNGDQADGDSDNIGDLCDNCAGTSNPDQYDADNDLLGDACDDCTDSDGDGYGDPGNPSNLCPDDNCPTVSNPDQTDTDNDGIGDACNFMLYTYDSVQTSCTRLIVGNSGNIGNDGNTRELYYGQANLDYAEFGDCDPSAQVYLYSGSPAIGYTDPYGTADYAMYNPTYSTLRIVTDAEAMTPTVTEDNYQIFRSGTFSTANLEVGLDKTVWAPTHSDSCNFVIECLRVFSLDGSTHSDITIGEVIDWDIPSDESAVNTFGNDQSQKLIYQRGVNYGYGGCQDNDRRFGGLAYLGSYHNNAAEIDSVTHPVGAIPIRAEYYVWPYGRFMSYDLYDLMQVSGYVTTSEETDIISLMTYLNDYTVEPDDTLYIYSVLATVRDGTLSDLQGTIDKAKAWFKSNILSGFYIVGDANGDGIINVSDAVHIINFIFIGGLPPDPYLAGDTNCDDVVNVSDAVRIINYIFIGGPAPGDC